MLRLALLLLLRVAADEDVKQIIQLEQPTFDSGRTFNVTKSANLLSEARTLVEGCRGQVACFEPL